MAQPLDLRKLMRVPTVWNYAIAPDGRTAAVVWDRSGQLEIYLVPLVGRGKRRQITSGPQSKMGPRFSPDGARLAYGQDYDGDENFDIFVYDLATGRARNLTPDTPDETINPYFTWSPDGRQLAFVSNREGQFATYILDVDAPEQVRRVTHHAYADLAPEWSPDGRHLAVTAATQGQDIWTFIVPVDGGEPHIVGGPSGPVDASQPRWSPDGKQIVFTSRSPGIDCIFTYNIAAGVLIRETIGTNEATEPDWSRDGRYLAFVWNEDGDLSVGVKDLATHAVAYHRLGPGIHSGPGFTRDSRRLLFLYEGPHQPSDLWALELKSGRPRQITRSLPRAFAGREFAAPRVVRWQSEGFTIPGLLYLPPGFRRGRSRPPAIVHVHGGPPAQYLNYWFPSLQHLISLGFVLLAPNYRGSTGYGRAFQEANRYDLGGGDMRDVIAGAEWLVQEGYADPNRIAISGTSYGGYLVMTALTKHPHVFAAGSAVVPFLNWFTQHENEREDLQHWDLENFGDPVKDADRYREYSPINFMHNITAPVMMIAGARDTRCPASETEQAAAILQDLDVPHEILIYPDEGHGFRKMNNRLDAYKQRAEFFARHLGVDLPQPAAQAKPKRRPATKKKAAAKKKTAPKRRQSKAKTKQRAPHKKAATKPKSKKRAASK